MKTVIINGKNLSLEDVELVSLGAKAKLAPEAKRRMRTSQKVVSEFTRLGKTIYGVNTGFGLLSDVAISNGEIEHLQSNLLRSHAVGVGPKFETAIVRTMMALRANCLAAGYSGVKPDVAEKLVELLNKGVHPIVPQKGSVGASGDLAPLAHMGLVLIGEGLAEYKGEILSGAEALARANIKPLALGPKDGLALINGTQASSAVGALTLLRAECLCKVADIAGAMTLDALEGTPAPFDPDIWRARPHKGHNDVSKNFLKLLQKSDIRKAHEECKKIQDAYSLRCIPQVHGAVRDALIFARTVLETEINSATDNPLVFAKNKKIVSAGNFHGQPLAYALDFVGIAATGLGSISERRIEKMINPAMSDGLPPFLAKNPGLESGFMIVQVSAASLVSENKVLAHPSSVDSIPTSADKEDHVSMSLTSALKAKQIVDNVENILAMELLVAAEGLEYRKPLKPGRGAYVAYRLIRRHVPPISGDREFWRDVERIKILIENGSLLKAVEKEIGPLM